MLLTAQHATGPTLPWQYPSAPIGTSQSPLSFWFWSCAGRPGGRRWTCSAFCWVAVTRCWGGSERGRRLKWRKKCSSWNIHAVYWCCRDPASTNKFVITPKRHHPQGKGLGLQLCINKDYGGVNFMIGSNRNGIKRLFFCGSYNPSSSRPYHLFPFYKDYSCTLTSITYPSPWAKIEVYVC